MIVNNATQVSPSPYIELRNQGTVLRYELTGAEHRLGRDPEWSDLVIPAMGWEIFSKRHCRFQEAGESYRLLDGDGITPSSNGIFLNHERIDGEQGVVLSHGLELSIGLSPTNFIRLTYLNPSQTLSAFESPKKQIWDLSKVQPWPLVLGRQGDVNPAVQNVIALNAPIISRRHALLQQKISQQYWLENLGVNGTFVNGQKISQPVLLQENDQIKIGPFILIFQGNRLELLDEGNQIRLDANQLYWRTKTEDGERILLNRISLTIEPGQFVALVGGSGTGKSTLMKALLGILPRTMQGKVYLNGSDLQQNFNLHRSEIGYVPQQDIVHAHLTIEEVLIYACRLRLPPDTEVETMVRKILEQIQLTHLRQVLVKNLSGGQRKRVSIGVELLANPKLFFLDEPTSGLDPGLDKELMLLFRELANQKRTIVLVTHTTNHIELCDRVAILGQGGYLCYYGPPHEATKFFGVPDFPSIYIQLKIGKTPGEIQRNSFEWNKCFEASPYFKKYINPFEDQRKSQLQTAPTTSLVVGNQHASQKSTPSATKVNWLQQTLLLSRRYGQLVWRDRRSLWLTFLTVPVSLLSIRLTLGNQIPFTPPEIPNLTQAPLALRVLFVFTCAMTWVGLSSSVQEIIQEIHIYARERLVNLQLIPYIGSKFGIRSGLALAQSLIITIVVLILGFGTPQSSIIPWPIGFAITTFLTFLANLSLGLMVSTLARNETEANNTLPLLLLPQIIFAGVLFQLDGWMSKIAWFMPSRWSIGAYGSLVDVNSMVSNHLLSLSPFQPASLYDPTWHNLLINWVALCLHSLSYLGTMYFWMRRKDVA
jgi:ABC-type multidrug transport system ATPase subunit